MALVTVTHRKVVTIPDDPNYPVGSNEWNDNHVITGLAPSATTDTTNASNITNGTLPAAQLPTPTATTLGGVKSLAAVAHQFLTQIGTDGTPAQAQPAFSDISGAVAASQLPQVTIRKPASAATIAIVTSDIEVGIDTRSTVVSVTLPSAAAWATANPFGLELVVGDYFGNAATNNITPSLFAGDSFAYGGITPVITANFGLLRLRPDPSLPGWIVRGVN